jgi:hypothetical protein
MTTKPVTRFLSRFLKASRCAPGLLAVRGVLSSDGVLIDRTPASLHHFNARVAGRCSNMVMGSSRSRDGSRFARLRAAA